jgi:hypothetical protein
MSPSYVSTFTTSSATRSRHVQVGRMKIPTPGGHAFILRRLDTNAISLTTMFRATYPQATEDAEKAEINWIKNNYELSGANKTGRARFAGTWAGIDVALNIADTYSISHLLPSLINAVPDPAQIYSKSRGKADYSATYPPAHPSIATQAHRSEQAAEGGYPPTYDACFPRTCPYTCPRTHRDHISRSRSHPSPVDAFEEPCPCACSSPIVSKEDAEIATRTR